MNESNSRFSLFSRSGEGGVIGGRGYNFQDAFIVSRIPNWLENPFFMLFIKEGIEDVDVKFKKGENEQYICYQIKDHIVKSRDFKKIIMNFNKKDESLHNIIKFILACRGFDDKGNSLKRVLTDFRELRRTYDKNMLDKTREEVLNRIKDIGLDHFCEFIINKVFFDTELGEMNSDKRLCDQFVGAILRSQNFGNVDNLHLRNTYRDLAHLVNITVRKPIRRSDIKEIIQESVESSSYQFKDEGIKIRLFHWEDPTFDLSKPWNLLLDWSEYFDRRNRKVPNSLIWNSILIPEVEEAEKLIRSSTDSRRILFYPSACLSAGFGLGWVFKEVKGYNFVIYQGSERWSSDGQPSTNKLILEHEDIAVKSTDLCVEISVAANVKKKVDEFIAETDKLFKARISLTPDLGIGTRIDNSIALAYANDAKKKIRENIDIYNCDVVHLFFSGPLGLSILLGRLFNALHANVQCYEEQLKGYKTTCLLLTN